MPWLLMEHGPTRHARFLPSLFDSENASFPSILSPLGAWISIGIGMGMGISTNNGDEAQGRETNHPGVQPLTLRKQVASWTAKLSRRLTGPPKAQSTQVSRLVTTTIRDYHDSCLSIGVRQPVPLNATVSHRHVPPPCLRPQPTKSQSIPHACNATTPHR